MKTSRRYRNHLAMIIDHSRRIGYPCCDAFAHTRQVQGQGLPAVVSATCPWFTILSQTGQLVLGMQLQKQMIQDFPGF